MGLCLFGRHIIFPWEPLLYKINIEGSKYRKCDIFAKSYVNNWFSMESIINICCDRHITNYKWINGKLKPQIYSIGRCHLTYLPRFLHNLTFLHKIYVKLIPTSIHYVLRIVENTDNNSYNIHYVPINTDIYKWIREHRKGHNNEV